MNLFDLVAVLRLDKTEYEKGIREAKDSADDFAESEEKATGSGGKLSAMLGGKLAVATKVAAAGAVALGTAVAGMTKKSVEAYAQYEQLVGGVDTLFKESSQLVQQYAANAYQTAGMSANAYMENVTAFSASLLQSLGNDTKAAAEYANVAMVDMSDNANRMGTSIDSIVATYQSLSRGNAAMLDNLKLGKPHYCRAA